jgi:hypothetical protein
LENIFDALPTLTAPAPIELCNELERYLNTDIEDVTDPIHWWCGKKTTYPQLHYMGLDYLMIPGLSYNLQSMMYSDDFDWHSHLGRH